MPHEIAFPLIDATTEFTEPRKRIHDERDVTTFRTSTAYARITAFILLLSDAMPDTSLLSPPSEPSAAVRALVRLLGHCEAWIERCPPHTGARRFGNLAFRDWHGLLESQASGLLRDLLPERARASLVELVPYFTGSFGSSQRLDFGTGHELSFIAFICCLFQLGILDTASREDARGVGLLVFPAYLRIIQRLVVIYTLEPAGSHGVWGLDDHFAMPYLLGAAQLANHEPETFPTPASITSKKDVEEFRRENLYYNAIGFINDVKKGPFWEHSPMLYDISGINQWDKISLGMRKMYNAEVLGKFPVVQHFPFGSCFFPFAGLQSQANGSGIPEAPQTLSGLPEEEEDEQRREHSDGDGIGSTRANTSRQAPTAVPWKSNLSQQVPTTAPWTTGQTRPTSITNQMSTSRTPNRVGGGGGGFGGQSTGPVSTTQGRPHAAQGGRTDRSMPPPAHIPSTTDRTTATAVPTQPESTEETANTEGLEEGLGVDGMPGTRAPFSEARTIHPAVLESMRRRGEAP